MDPLASLLDAPRSRQTHALRVQMSGSWGIAVDDGAPLTLCAVLGEACHLARGDHRTRLEAGDVLVVVGPQPYLLSSEERGETTVLIGPGGACSGPGGRDLATEMSLGLRRWGNDPRGTSDLLIATYATQSEVGRQLLTWLPEQIVERTRIGGLREVLTGELDVAGPGQTSVVNRLLDVLLVATLRQWAQRPTTARSWWTASRDPAVASALRHLEDDEAGALSLAELSRRVGLSRAAFTRRFRAAVGASPGEYARRVRMASAADLLRTSDLPLAAVGRRFGYASAYGFSHAFSAHFGLSPSQYRAQGVGHADEK